MTLKEWRRERLAEYNVNEVYYFGYIDNLASYLTHGILPKNDVDRKGIPHKSFAEEEVQERRHTKKIELSDSSQRRCHDLVPVYLVPLTPTLSVRRNIQDQLVFIVIDAEMICDEGIQFAFSNGNSGSAGTTFYRNLRQLSEIPWGVVRAKYWKDFEDGTRKRNSEFLIYPHITPNYFKKIVVNTELLRQAAQGIVFSRKLQIPVELDVTFFFN